MLRSNPVLIKLHSLKVAKKKNIPAVATFHSNMRPIFRSVVKSKFIAELMVQLGFVRELDVKSIIFMKEEAGKRFSLSTKDIPTIALEKESYDIRVENTKLKEENEILKEKINAILTYIKEHKESSQQPEENREV